MRSQNKANPDAAQPSLNGSSGVQCGWTFGSSRTPARTAGARSPSFYLGTQPLKLQVRTPEVRRDVGASKDPPTRGLRRLLRATRYALLWSRNGGRFGHVCRAVRARDEAGWEIYRRGNALNEIPIRFRRANGELVRTVYRRNGLYIFEVDAPERSFFQVANVTFSDEGGTGDYCLLLVT